MHNEIELVNKAMWLENLIQLHGILKVTSSNPCEYKFGIIFESSHTQQEDDIFFYLSLYDEFLVDSTL